MYNYHFRKIKVFNSETEIEINACCCVCISCMNERKLGSYIWSYDLHDFVKIVEISEDGLTIWVE